MKHLEMDEPTTPACKEHKRHTYFRCCLREKQEWRREVIAVKGLVHDSHFYVNARPEVKCRGTSVRKHNKQ